MILYSTYIISKDQDKFQFYINNYINLNQFNQLYDLNCIEKDIKITNLILCKLELTTIRAINNMLKVAQEKMTKKQKKKQ